MEINYEDIITKANARKEALIGLTTLLNQAEENSTKLIAVRDWLDTVKLAFIKLDNEGKEMLPDHVLTALNKVSITLSELNNVLYRYDGYSHYGITQLKEKSNV